MYSYIKAQIKNVKGVLLVGLFSIIAVKLSTIKILADLRISPLVVGIILGIIFANTLRPKLSNSFDKGIIFSAKKILRFAIVFYGFRITFQEILEVGLEGLLISILMVSTTFLIGVFLGTKIFKLDKETSILTSSGSAICGAAAILATESVLKPKEGHKAAVSVSTVVLFGTIAMFIYPIIFKTDILNFDETTFGVYTGGTVHEVAQVVAVGSAISKETADNAIIVKMTRVMLIAPFLLILGSFLLRSNKSDSKTKLVITIGPSKNPACNISTIRPSIIVLVSKTFGLIDVLNCNNSFCVPFLIFLTSFFCVLSRIASKILVQIPLYLLPKFIPK